MRGSDARSGSLFSYLDLEARVAGDHPLRVIRSIADEVLVGLSARFEAAYARLGRPSIATHASTTDPDARLYKKAPGQASQRWSLAFASDALSCGRRFRVLCVIDDFSRECRAAIVDTSLSGLRVARELARVVARRPRSTP